MLYTAIFDGYKNDNVRMKICDILLIFAQNIDCGYTLEPPQLEPHEAVLTGTHDLCFRANIRKNVYSCKPKFYSIKAVCKGVYITLTCFHDVTIARHLLKPPCEVKLSVIVFPRILIA